MALQGFIWDSPIPPELGNLTELEFLYIGNGTALIGPIPPQLGNLSKLEHLSLRMSRESHYAIPSELGTLTKLKLLEIRGRMTGTIPPELGELTNLEYLWLSGNMTGPIPTSFENLTNLELLVLAGLHLSGPVPAAMRNLVNLESLFLGSICRERGGDPEECAIYESDLCASSDGVQDWLAGYGVEIRRCGTGLAHLTQAVQSRMASVPLVADEAARLHIFDLPPPVRARFYLDGTEVHVADIPRFDFDVVGSQADGFGGVGGALVPASVVRPGLEMVIEGEQGRIPEEGRQSIDVREMPPFNLTVIPFLLDGQVPPDSAHVAIVDSMAADPQQYWRLAQTADLLPIGAIQVTAHAPVVTDGGDAATHWLLGETGFIRTMEGGTGHWMGLANVVGWSAQLGGWVSYSNANPTTIAHELGHNFSLRHTPGTGNNEDPTYPYADGSIGAWGYTFRDVFGDCGSLDCSDYTPYYYAGQHVDPLMARDVMSYSSPKWISDYHFSKALEYRLERDRTHSEPAVRGPVRSLVLWGGVDPAGTPFLEPAFVVDAPPSLPVRRGAWTLEGRNSGGSVLFSLPFSMPVIADAGEGAGGFAFALPVRVGWDALATVTLSGPGGTAVMDGSTHRPMSIWRDEKGQVRAILRAEPIQADGAFPLGLAATGIDVLFSGGIPDSDAWRER